MRGGRGRGGFYPEICLKNSQFLAREMSVSGCDIWRRIHVAGDVIDAPRWRAGVSPDRGFSPRIQARNCAADEFPPALPTGSRSISTINLLP